MIVFIITVIHSSYLAILNCVGKLGKMSEPTNSTQKTYHKKASGAALNTVKKHAKEHDLKLYGSCFW